MSEVTKRISDMPETVQLGYQVRAMQHLIVNLIMVLRAPLADFVGQKPVVEVRGVPNEVAHPVFAYV